MMKKTLCMVLILVLSISVMGCGKGVNKEKVTLKVGLPSGKEITPMEIVEEFKIKNADSIDLVVDEAPWTEFKNKLKMQIAAGNPSDVFFIDSGYTATLGAMGAVVDLSNLLKKDLKEEEYSKALFSGRDDNGRVWGVPHALNAIAIAYNKSIFDNAGVAYPDENWTFQDMFDTAAKLTKDFDKDGEMDQYGMIYSTNITEGWLPFLLSTGGAPIDKTRSKSLLNTPESMEGIKKYYEGARLGITPPVEWVAANGNKLGAFYMGKAGMITTQVAGIKVINTNAPEGFKYDVQMMPIGWDGQRNCIYVPNQWSIFSKTSNEVQDAAWKFLKHYLSQDSQDLVAKECPGGIPIKKSALEKVSTYITTPANIEAFYKGIDEYGVTLFEGEKWQEWVTEVSKSFSNIYTGVMSPEEGAAKAYTDMQGILNGL